MAQPACTISDMRAAVYCRISADPTGQQAGVRRQEDDCRRLADDLGWTVADVFVDNDLSASTGKRRPAYERLLAAVEAGEIDAIIAWHPDRLYRLTRELERIIDVVRGAGAEVRTVTAGEVDLSTPSGRMVARIIGATAQGEVEHKAERQRAANRRAAEAGRLSGRGRRAFGYAPDRSEVVEAEAEVVREVADRLLAGESQTSVCRDLNERGITTTAGNPWRPARLREMIRSPHLAGLRSHRGEVVARATWPAILDEVTHRRLARAFDGRRRTTVRRHLLSGLLVCGAPLGHSRVCGAAMYGVHLASLDQTIYRCMRREGYAGCGRLSIGVEVEGWLCARVAIAYDRVDDDGDDRRDRLVEAVADADGRLAELSRMWAEGELARSEWQAAREVHQRRLDEAERALREADASEQRVRDAVDVRRKLAEGDVWTRRALVERVVERVVVAPALPGRAKFDPGRLTVDWRV